MYVGDCGSGAATGLEGGIFYQTISSESPAHLAVDGKACSRLHPKDVRCDIAGHSVTGDLRQAPGRSRVSSSSCPSRQRVLTTGDGRVCVGRAVDMKGLSKCGG